MSDQARYMIFSEIHKSCLRNYQRVVVAESNKLRPAPDIMAWRKIVGVPSSASL